MFILQSLKDFVDNPMGKGSMAIPNRQLIKDDLNRRYEKLTKDKKIKLDVYKDGEDYYFHFMIPSESERLNTYDVVLQFTMGDEDFKYDNFLNRYFIKFFSNCPSFTYTYAYAFNLYGLLIEHLGNKYDEKVLTDDPVVRNPGEIISYEKSIYFACYHILQHRQYMNKMHLNQIAKAFEVQAFNKLIRNTAKIELEIKQEESRISREKEAEKSRENDKKAALVNKAKKAITGKEDKDKVKSSSPSINRIKPMQKTKPRTSTVSKSRPK